MIVLIIQPWIKVGGAELLSLHLAEQLERRGHAAPIAALFVDREGLPPALLRRRFVVPPAPVAELFRRSRMLLYLLGPPVLLWLVARASAHADVLEPHNVPAPFVAALVGRVRRKPVVWQCNEIPRPLRAAYALGPGEALVWRLASRLAARSARAMRAIIVLSERERADVRSRYGREAVVVRPGLGLVARAAQEARPPGAHLLWVGKLHPQKDPLTALHVTADLVARGHDVSLTIVGSGPLRDAVAATAEELGIGGRVTLRGRVADAELPRLYASHHVLLVTADASQSWGLTPFEALASGTPAVVPAVIGAAELLGPNEAALVTAPARGAYADAVERILRDEALSRRIVANGRALIERELTWDRFAERCIAVFERALA